MGGQTPVVDDPPSGSIGSLLNLPSQLEGLLFGQNADMTPAEFLLHAQTSHAERVDHHIQQYRAMIYTIGIIAGVVGTDAERDEILAAIEETIRKYGKSLAEQNVRETWYDDFNTPIDVLSTAAGAIETAWGGTQKLAGQGIQAAGDYFESDTANWIGEGLENLGDEDIREGIDTIYTNYDGMAVQMVKDLWNSIVDGAKQWWDWFTTTVDSEGLIIALGQAHVDASFLVAEIAIDVGIGLVTAGWGGAAFRAIRIVGRRVLDGATDVVVKVVREGAEAIDVKHLRHADSDIPADIQDKVPDLEDVQGHPDVEADTTPNAETPTTTRVRGKTPSLRDQYMGATPRKTSTTGGKVIERMRRQGKFDDGPPPQFEASDGNWYNLNEADMAHKTDAVSYWNSTGRYYGAKSNTVRTWMRDPDNYYLEHYSINRSQGGQLTERYLDPIDINDPAFRGAR